MEKRFPLEMELSQLRKFLPLGTFVSYWRGGKDGSPSGRGHTTTEVTDLHGHAVVWIEGCSGCIHLSHVEPTEYPTGD